MSNHLNVKKRDKLTEELVDVMERQRAEIIANLLLYADGQWELEPHELKRWQELGFLNGKERKIIFSDPDMYKSITNKRDALGLNIALVLMAWQYEGIVEYR
jgi:hypothetical protein